MLDWVTLALGSAILLAAYDICKKVALKGNLALFVVWSNSFIGWIVLSLAYQTGLLLLPVLSWRQHGLIAVKSALASAAWIFIFQGFKHLPISLAAPIRSSSPLFVLVGAILLFREVPQFFQWAGICVILISFWTLNAGAKSEENSLVGNVWVYSLFFGVILASASGLYDKSLLQSYVLPPIAFQYWFIFYNTLIQSVLFVAWMLFSKKSYDQFRWTWYLPVISLLLIVADQVYFQAMSQADALISVATVIRRSSVLISVPIGGLLFNEKLLGSKLIATVILIIGLIFIYI